MIHVWSAMASRVKAPPGRPPSPRLDRPASENSGLFIYFVLTCGLSWISAWVLKEVWRGAEEPVITRLLTVSLLYAVTMGWQPYVALWCVERWRRVSRRVDLGLHPVSRASVLQTIGASVMFVLLATSVAWSASRLGILTGPPLFVSAEPAVGLQTPSFGWLTGLILAFGLAVTTLWIQAFVEELGWRGYFLSGLMHRVGPWKGLFLHGLWWGVWYAPLLLIINGGWERSLARTGGFVITCVCLGVLLGWLRLATKSIIPSVMANLMLTLAAGLPFLLQGWDVGLRGAAYGPAGWMLTVVILSVLMFSRYRQAVVVPEGRGEASHAPMNLWWLAKRAVRLAGAEDCSQAHQGNGSH